MEQPPKVSWNTKVKWKNKQAFIDNHKQYNKEWLSSEYDRVFGKPAKEEK